MVTPSTIHGDGDGDGDDLEPELEPEGGDERQQEPVVDEEVEGFVMKNGNLLGAPLPPPPRPEVRPAVRDLLT